MKTHPLSTLVAILCFGSPITLLRAEREAIRRAPREGSSWAEVKSRLIEACD
jgi:hypothetical protein